MIFQFNALGKKIFVPYQEFLKHFSKQNVILILNNDNRIKAFGIKIIYKHPRNKNNICRTPNTGKIRYKETF